MIPPISFASGLIFGLGLIAAGMSDPAKVVGFLDLFGIWDPSLALVMGGAIAIGLGGFALAKRRTRSMLGPPMRLVDSTRIDGRLLVGSAMFGIGWGLAGICPGPALVLMGTGSLKGWVFAAAMAAGMGLFHIRQHPPGGR